MVMLEEKIQVTAQELAAFDADQMNEYLNEQVRERMTNRINEALDEMSFVDMSMDDNGLIELEASLVLCPTEEVHTSLQMQATKLFEFGLNEQQVEEILSIGTTDKGGF